MEITTLKQEIQSIDINVFTDNNIIRDIKLIQQLTINNQQLTSNYYEN